MNYELFLKDFVADAHAAAVRVKRRGHAPLLILEVDSAQREPARQLNVHATAIREHECMASNKARAAEADKKLAVWRDAMEGANRNARTDQIGTFAVSVR